MYDLNDPAELDRLIRLEGRGGLREVPEAMRLVSVFLRLRVLADHDPAEFAERLDATRVALGQVLREGWPHIKAHLLWENEQIDRERARRARLGIK